MWVPSQGGHTVSSSTPFSKAGTPTLPWLGLRNCVTWKKQSCLSLKTHLHNGLRVKATQMSIHGWTDKQNVAYTYKGIVFSLKKEENSNTCCNLVEPWGHSPKRENTVPFHLDEVPRVVKFIETGSGMGLREEETNVVVHRVSVLQDERVLEIGCITKWIFLTPQKWTFKNGYGNSLAVQWLGLRAFTAKGTGSIPGWGTKIPHAAWHGQKIKIN